MRKPKIVALLDSLEHKLGAPDHDVFFHLREIALDLVRHHASLAEIDARLAAGKLDRRGALRALEDLRTEFTAATLVHWDYHLDELRKDLRRRLRAPRRRTALRRTRRKARRRFVRVDAKHRRGRSATGSGTATAPRSHSVRGCRSGADRPGH